MQKKDEPTYCVQCEDPGNFQKKKYLLNINENTFFLNFIFLEVQKFTEANFKPSIKIEEPIKIEESMSDTEYQYQQEQPKK